MRAWTNIRKTTNMLAVFPGGDDRFSPLPLLPQEHRMQIQLRLNGAATLLRVVDCNVSEVKWGQEKLHKIEESLCFSSALASATSTGGNVPANPCVPDQNAE